MHPRGVAAVLPERVHHDRLGDRAGEGGMKIVWHAAAGLGEGTDG
jgi:hypothetical protein